MATSNRTKPSARAQRKRSTRSGSKSATTILSAADALHAELLEQVKALMNAREGSKRCADLTRIGAVVEAYERVRWPIIQAVEQGAGDA